MLVPRSFQHSQRRSRTPDTILQEEKGAMRANRGRVPSPSKQNNMEAREQIQEEQRPPTPPIDVPQRRPALQTLPMTMPVRQNVRSPPTTQTVRVKGQHGDRRSLMPKNHRNDAVPPSVAALLAVTSIPPRALHPSRRRSAPPDQKISIDQLVEEWRKDEKGTASSHDYGSPMDILLERPEDSEMNEDVVTDSLNEKQPGAVSSRSISSDSLDSLPSLDNDEQSLASWSTGHPDTPQSLRRGRFVSSPSTEDCVLDHPLLHYSLEAAADDEQLELPELISTPQKPVQPRSSFKSNLTASFQALKAAARSFSNFTAPSVPPDDLLTRSILSPRYTSEMRPKPLEGLPTPALRRYLNPLSPTELSMPADDGPNSGFASGDGPMIQMQTYDRKGRNNRRRRASVDPRSEAGRALSSDPTVRQREPRENSNFLRVIVLEMNMRREGKLDPKAMGKARIWLPPRKMESVETVQDKRNVVPTRWVGVGIDDV